MVIIFGNIAVRLTIVFGERIMDAEGTLTRSPDSRDLRPRAGAEGTLAFIFAELELLL
jgi:hypothetical protein